MTYRTHLAAGYAAVLWTFSPDTIAELILCTGTAAIGSVVSDVDASASRSKNDLAKVSAVTFLSILQSIILLVQTLLHVSVQALLW